MRFLYTSVGLIVFESRTIVGSSIALPGFLKNVIEDVRGALTRAPLTQSENKDLCDLSTRSYQSSPILMRLVDIVKSGGGFTDEERDSFCFLSSRLTTSDWTDLHQKALYALVAKVNNRLNSWPADRWLSLYEMKCAQVGAFVRLEEHGKKANIFIAKLFRAMKTNDQRFELCQLLAEPLEGEQYPRTKVSELLEAANKVNTHAPELSKICAFETLRSRKNDDLKNAEILILLLPSPGGAYTESIVEACKSADSTKSLSESLKIKLNVSDTKIKAKLDMILELDKECSLDVLFKYMGRTPAARLAEFVELGRMDSSKKMKDEVCEILREFLRERASRETADPEAGRDILSVYLKKRQSDKTINDLLVAWRDAIPPEGGKAADN